MSNFFQQAPVQDTYQKRFLEAVFQRQDIIASFPLNYAPVSMYALAAMMGDGMAVALCPNSAAIRHNLEYFKQAGFRFPEVAFLDGTQMPHEERQIEQEVNHNRVRLLYVTPERFISLTFLKMMVHTPITFLLIEEADRLLPGVPGHGSYKRFYEEGLRQLGQPPPLALMTPALPPARLEAVAGALKLAGFQRIECPPRTDNVELTVALRFSEHQKFRALVSMLSGHPGKGKLGRLDGPGAVLIQTAFPAQAEKLGASLIDYGFDSVWITHHKRTPREQAQVAEVAATRPQAIVVSAGLDQRSWQPPTGASPRVVFWSPPLGLEDLWMQLFRQAPGRPGGTEVVTQGLILYTKEDYQDALQRLKPSRYLEPKDIRARERGLEDFRQWVLSKACRVQSLAAFYQGEAWDEAVPPVGLPRCGVCDRCREDGQGRGLVREWLRRWLF